MKGVPPISSGDMVRVVPCRAIGFCWRSRETEFLKKSRRARHARGGSVAALFQVFHRPAIARGGGVLGDLGERPVIEHLALARLALALQQLGDLLGGDIALQRRVVADVHGQEALVYVVASALVAGAAG